MYHEDQQAQVKNNQQKSGEYLQKYEAGVANIVYRLPMF